MDNRRIAGDQHAAVLAAMRMLHGEQSIAGVGLACGFTDQSAFTRQFKATTGMPPRVYRAMVLAESAHSPQIVNRSPAAADAHSSALGR